MSQINDAILSATGGPTVNDGLLAFYKLGGATSNDLQDAEREFLIIEGATPAALQDMWFELLRAAPFEGALDDMRLQFWGVGGVFVPLAFLQMGGGPGRAETPDSVLNSVAGDIDIRVLATANSWQPGGNRIPLSKWDSNGNQRSYRLRMLTGGFLEIQISTDGSGGGSISSSQSTVAFNFTDNTKHWIRGTLDVTANVSNFFTSDDGIVWTPLGAVDVAHVTTGAFDSSNGVEIGSSNQGTTTRWVGRIHKADVLDGIDGTVAVDFDPTGRAGLFTWTGSLGETWDVFPPASIIAGV